MAITILIKNKGGGAIENITDEAIKRIQFFFFWLLWIWSTVFFFPLDPLFFSLTTIGVRAGDAFQAVQSEGKGLPAPRGAG